ncbi:MAG: hypothetical protein ACUVRT_15615 [Armatimonadota bacterium]
MLRLLRARALLWAAGLALLLWSPASQAGNGCRDTIRPSCRYVGDRTIACCQIMSDKYVFAPCRCKQYQDARGFNYFNGGITDTGPSCVQQNDICC